MANFDNKRNWLLIIAIAAMVVLLWNNGPSLFHFHWNVPFWPIAIVLFCVWWMTGGKYRARGCGCGCDCGSDDCCEGASRADAAEASDSSSDPDDEESANKA